MGVSMQPNNTAKETKLLVVVLKTGSTVTREVDDEKDARQYLNVLMDYGLEVEKWGLF